MLREDAGVWEAFEKRIKEEGGREGGRGGKDGGMENKWVKIMRQKQEKSDGKSRGGGGKVGEEKVGGERGKMHEEN